MSDFVAKAKMDWGEPIINFKFEENKMFETHTTTDTRVEDPVNHPSHYTDGPALGRLECLDITRWLPFDLGNAFKYVWRAGKKDPAKMAEDLEKAKFYLIDWFDELRTWQSTLYHGRAAAEVLFYKTDYRQWESWRYRALRSILCGNVEDAINIIEHQLNALEAAESEAEAERQFNSGCSYEPEDETNED